MTNREGEAPPLHEADGAEAPAGGRAVWLEAVDGVRLRAAFWPGGGRGTVVVFQGRTEFIEKYYEPIGRFLAMGFAAAAIDWRGQGLSDRAFPDRRKGYVGDFAEFQKDVDALLRRLDATDAPKPWVLVGHSMGGAIAARALMRQDVRLAGDLIGDLAMDGGGPFSAAVLSAPMLGLYGKLQGGGFARAVASLAVMIGRRDRYTVGCDRNTSADLGFDANVLTTDEKRFDAYAALVKRHETLALGGPTWGWLRAAVEEIAALKPSATPTLLAIGTSDTVVSIAASERYVDNAPNAEILKLPGARHEPFIENDASQTRLWSAVAAFLEQNEI